MRLKSRFVIIALLSTMLVLTFFASLNYSKQNKVIDNDTSSQTDDIKPEEYIMPDSFKGTIKNEYNVPEDVLNVVVSYMDAYYKSLYTLEQVDVSEFFIDEYYGKMSNYANKLVLDIRKLYDFDFGLNKAHYDLNIIDYSFENGIHHIDFLEDDYFNFKFLNDIESQVFDIEGYFEIKEVDGQYKISKLYKEQGYYLNFYESTENSSELEKTYDYYYSQLKDMVKYNNEVLKERASRTVYSPSKKASNPYNRTAAIEYANKYYHTRNPEWYDFSYEGGNCQNYASQCMYAGGIPMDFLGEDQWKNYIEDPEYEPELNYSETQSGRTASWVHVSSFYEYALYNEGFGLLADLDANLYFAEPGDLILVGNGGMAHTFIVSRVVDGHILVHSNSIDMKDFPIEASTYTYLKLIKILGSN